MLEKDLLQIDSKCVLVCFLCDIIGQVPKTLWFFVRRYTWPCWFLSTPSKQVQQKFSLSCFMFVEFLYDLELCPLLILYN